MYLTIQDFFYLIAIFFTTIIGTLSIIVLLKTIKILRVFDGVFYYIEKIKEVLHVYHHISETIKNKIVDTLFGKK